VVAVRACAAGLAGPPATAGVYAFRDAAGALLYVGASGDLARRVRSYFAPGHPRASKAGRIARLAATVEWTTCGSPLEAFVAEAHAIRRERPHFNRRLKHVGGYAWVRVDLRDPFPRLDVTRAPADGPWRYLGPFPGGRRLAGAVAALADALGLRTCPGTLAPDPGARACLRHDLGQCRAPCRGRVSPGDYGRQLVRAFAALGGVDVPTARAAGARATTPPAPLPAAVAGALAALQRAQCARAVVALVPAAGAPGHRLVACAAGRLRAAFAVRHPADLAGALAGAARALAPAPPLVVEREALDEVRIVTAWLASPEGRAASVDVARLGWRATAAGLAARLAPGPLFAGVSGRDPRAPA